jgi:hypothetical protein
MTSRQASVSKKGLAEVGEGGGGFGFDLALSDGGEEAAQGGAEVAGGEITVGEVRRDVAARLLGGEGLGFFAGMERAEVRGSGENGSDGHRQRRKNTRRNGPWRDG